MLSHRGEACSRMIGSSTRGGATEASMNRKASAKFMAGAVAAVLFMGAAPEAEARNNTRSAKALPTVSAMQSFQARGSFTSVFTPGRSTQSFATPSFGQSSRATTPIAGLIFGFLPDRVQDLLLARLAQTPRGDRVCAILGVPGCVRNDSPG